MGIDTVVIAFGGYLEKARKTKPQLRLDFNDASQLWGYLDSMEVPSFCDKEPRWV